MAAWWRSTRRRARSLGLQVPAGNPSTRGVEYWPGDARRADSIFGTSNGRLFSLDAKTGKPNETFGDKGSVDLNTPEIEGLPGATA